MNREGLVASGKPLHKSRTLVSMSQQGADSRVVADSAHSTIEAVQRYADPATRLMVDEMILDYLLYMAAKVMLEDRRAEKEELQPSSQDCRADLHLSMVDSFLTVFKANYPAHLASIGMQFRLRLLQFTTLLMRRVTKWLSTPPLPTLQTIRRQNRERASVWLSHSDPSSTFPAQIRPMLKPYDSTLPLPKATLLRNREHVSAVLKADRDPLSFYGLPSSPSLLDTLTGFMALSAAQAAMISSVTITNAWMMLAAQYMTQSALEQYLAYGERGSEPLLEAFSWGFDACLVADAISDEWRTNAMFWDANGEVEGWKDIRDRHMRAFIPEPGESLKMHLEDLAVRNPVNKFEDDIIAFLEALLVCQPKPILAQMEAAELNGISGLKTGVAEAESRLYKSMRI